MRKLLGVILALSCGAAVGDECTSPVTAVWTEPDASILWKTIREPSVDVSVDWPELASSALISVVRDGHEIVSDTLTDKAVKIHSLALDLPLNETDEAVLDMTLTFRDVNGTVLEGETRRASVGLVRGMNGRSCRVVSPYASAKRWGAVGGSAVVPVYDDTASVTLDGDELAVSGRPGWTYLPGLTADCQMLVLTSKAGESLSIPVFSGVGGLLLLFK